MNAAQAAFTRMGEESCIMLSLSKYHFKGAIDAVRALQHALGEVPDARAAMARPTEEKVSEYQRYLRDLAEQDVFDGGLQNPAFKQLCGKVGNAGFRGPNRETILADLRGLHGLATLLEIKAASAPLPIEHFR
jgi:hypothetical protein